MFFQKKKNVVFLCFLSTNQNIFYIHCSNLTYIHLFFIGLLLFFFVLFFFGNTQNRIKRLLFVLTVREEEKKREDKKREDKKRKEKFILLKTFYFWGTRLAGINSHFEFLFHNSFFFLLFFFFFQSRFMYH